MTPLRIPCDKVSEAVDSVNAKRRGYEPSAFRRFPLVRKDLRQIGCLARVLRSQDRCTRAGSVDLRGEGTIESAARPLTQNPFGHVLLPTLDKADDLHRDAPMRLRSQWIVLRPLLEAKPDPCLDPGSRAKSGKRHAALAVRHRSCRQPCSPSRAPPRQPSGWRNTGREITAFCSVRR